MLCSTMFATVTAWLESTWSAQIVISGGETTPR